MRTNRVRYLYPALFLVLFFSACTHESAENIFDLSKAKWTVKEVSGKKTYKATVPGTIHTDLYNNREIPDPFYRNNENDLQWIGEKDWEYSTLFDIPAEMWARDRLEIQFDGLDTYADVMLNDSLILQADNCFRSWEAEIRSLVQRKNNRLKVIFYSAAQRSKAAQKISDIPLDVIYPYTRKPAYHFGWDWGPVFITAGIYKAARIIGWNTAKITNTHIIQESLSDSTANLRCVYEIQSASDVQVSLSVFCSNIDERTTRTIELHPGLNTIELPFEINSPRRWWSNGLGEAYLYRIETEMSVDAKIIDSSSERFGLRTLRLVQSPDSLGTSFYFELNGTPVFMKGANYIPQDMFLNRPSPEDYRTVIKNAKDANMNMLRVWGGGFYENDIFYDLCDENGILVWQDFMFACALYPADNQFLENVRQEAIQNIKRLRNHPSIALWCGNNENYDGWLHWGWTNGLASKDSLKLWNDYEKLFHRLLPDLIAEYDAGRDYWPSSPSTGWGGAANTRGDVHYWGVWHGQQPFEVFQQPEHIGRFVSEYGFQGAPMINSVKRFTIAPDRDISSRVMKNHQKHRIGYPVIDTYFDRYYNKPKDFESYLYLSQIQQAFGIGMAIEAHRRTMPDCMGTLYWQLNDCYPVTSWSGIDSYGKWKALHYRVRQLYKTLLVSPFVQNGIFRINVVSDSVNAVTATLNVKLIDFYGQTVRQLKQDVRIPANSSRIYFDMVVDSLLQTASKSDVVLIAKLNYGTKNLAENHYFFELTKRLNLKKPQISLQSTPVKKGFILTLESDIFAKDVMLETEDGRGFFTKNFFDITPGNPVTTILIIDNPDYDIRSNVKIYNMADATLSNVSSERGHKMSEK